MRQTVDAFQPEQQQPTSYEIFSVNLLWRTCKREFGSWVRLLTLISSITFLWLTFVNYFHRWFPLLPVFDHALAAFRAVCHAILKILVLSWFTFLLDCIWFATLWIVNFFWPMVMEFPRIAVPPWLIDLLLISIAFAKVFDRAEDIVSFQRRDEAERHTNPDEMNAMSQKEGTIFGSIHDATTVLNALNWRVTNTTSQFVGMVIRRVFPSSRVYEIFEKVCFVTIRGLLMGGIIRFVGYTIHIGFTGGLHNPILEARRVFFCAFLLLLLVSSLACAIFFVINGYFL
jgi:hypothetical protein